MHEVNQGEHRAPEFTGIEIMEASLENLQNVFGGSVDLAALASGAGFFGGSASAIAVAFFRGAIIRFVIRTISTALLTGVGFLFLLDFLGFEIVPPEEYRDQFQFGQSMDSTETIEKTDEDGNRRRIIIHSPYRRHG